MNHQIAQMIIAQRQRDLAVAAERHRHLFGVAGRRGPRRRSSRSPRQN